MRLRASRWALVSICITVALPMVGACATSNGGGTMTESDVVSLPVVIWRRVGDSRNLWLSPTRGSPVPNVMILDDMEVAGIGRLSRDFLVVPSSASVRPSASYFDGPCYRESRQTSDTGWIKCVRIEAAEAFRLDPVW